MKSNLLLRTLCSFLLVSFSLLGNQSSAADPGKAQHHQHGDGAAQISLYVHYHYTTETTYEDVEIKDSVLKFTSLNETSKQRIKKEAAGSVESKRFWTDADLITREAALSQEQLEELVKVIRQSSFLQLAGSYGGGGPGGRHYPEKLSIQLREAKKEVTLKHFPGGTGMPGAFATVRQRLFAVVHEKFP